MTRKTKIYIDTSVWNFALETDRLDSSLTYEFLELLKNSEYIPVVSNVVMAEIEASYEPRKTLLLDLIDVFSPEMVIADDAASKLAEVYIEEKIIPKTHLMMLFILLLHQCTGVIFLFHGILNIL